MNCIVLYMLNLHQINDYQCYDVDSGDDIRKRSIGMLLVEVPMPRLPVAHSFIRVPHQIYLSSFLAKSNTLKLITIEPVSFFQ